MIPLIDNYDSFTYNLVQILEGMNQGVKVFRNDQITLARIAKEGPSGLVISPGPCTPAQAGISVGAVRYFAAKIPVLGVCLGHQSIATAYGGKMVRAERIMHVRSPSFFTMVRLSIRACLILLRLSVTIHYLWKGAHCLIVLK